MQSGVALLRRLGADSVHFWDGSPGGECHDAGMRIFHIATVADWERAQQSGAYATSTRGRSLEEEGFLHAAHRPQVQGVFQRYYQDVREPLVLLTIDTERLWVPWREEEVSDEFFPHIYGPLSPRAVVDVQPLNRRGGTEPFTSLFVWHNPDPLQVSGLSQAVSDELPQGVPPTAGAPLVQAPV